MPQWSALARHVAAHRHSAEFTGLEKWAAALRGALDRLQFNVLVRGGRVWVGPTDGEQDLQEKVTATFERFRQGKVEDHRTTFDSPTMDHVQAWILQRVAQVQPQVFTELTAFTGATAHYRVAVLDRFTREVQFYLSYLSYLDYLTT